MTAYLEEQIRQLPQSPGVYLMKDAGGGIIYIGKAARLRARVRSYFGRPDRLTPKTQRLVERIRDIDFFITGTEQEALILELNLVRRHRPHYNVSLKDDKSFPYLKIDTGERWPRIYITRQLSGTGRYFGPFADAKSVRRTLALIKEIFPLRTCAKSLKKRLPRACLEYDIGQCNAPCIDAVSQRQYAELLKQTILFLEGKQDRVIKELEDKMRRVAEGQDYEQAARLRDQIQAVKKVIEGQQIAARVRGEQDVISFAQDRDQACVQVYFIRSGKLIGRETFTLQGTKNETPSRIMSSFVEQYYNSATHIPPLILLQHPVEDSDIIESWLAGKRKGRVKLQVPRRGSKKELVDIVAENAGQALALAKIKHLAAPETLEAALDELKAKLNLPSAPLRMEGYDISNIQGTAASGSMVVFERGRPTPSRYRRFRIKTVAGADDCAMIAEVIRRRFRHHKETASPSADSWATRPGLVLIDGGKGQLAAAMAAMREAGAESIPLASLAKENEDIYLPGRARPLILLETSPALRLLQRLRDEAHRFALGYHHKIHHRQTFASALDDIPGIGPRRKRSLIKQFGSVKAIRQAGLEELAAASGMSQRLAEKIKENL
ncbi:MAG: excinuclease ABC subunit UvrC [Dehalococcoidales bacterium]